MARRTVAGVEITQEAVRAAEVTVGAAPELVAFGEVALPPGAARDSEVLDREVVVAAVRQLWSGAGIRARKATIGVGSKRILVREFSTPAESVDKITDTLPPHIQDALPVPVGEAILDFHPLAEYGGVVQGMLVAAPAKTIECLVDVLQRARIRPANVDVVPFGLARVAGMLGSAKKATLMIHIGEHTTQLVMAIHGAPRFVRILPFDIGPATAWQSSAIAHLAADPVDVAMVTDVGGRASLRIGASQPTPVIAADPVGELIARLQETIDFYQARPGSVRIGAAFVSGPGATAPGVLSAIAAAVPCPVREVGVDQLVQVRAAHPGAEAALALVSTVGTVLGRRA